MMNSKSIPANKRKSRKLEPLQKRQQFYGRMFTLPWLIGFVLFFFIPIIQSIWYSFSKAGPLDEVNTSVISFLKDKITYFENYRYIWLEQPDFLMNLKESISSFVFSLPIIIVLSLVLAIFLNQKFHGRLVARAVFFLPVIIATGVVVQIISNDMIASQLREGQSDGGIYRAVNFSNMLMNMGLPQLITGQIADYISGIFDLLWSAGVQTILFLAGLQAVPASMYEAADVEGATSWEKFWFITIPLILNVILLNIIYTSIELFTTTNNPAMQQVYQMIMQSDYNASSAIVWSYCLIIGSIIAIILLAFTTIFKKIGDDS